MKNILCILVLLVSIGCMTAEATAGKSYTCKEACTNYKQCKCKSDLDKYNCLDACRFAQSVGMISQKQLNCTVEAKTCKEMFSCVGYKYGK